MQQAILAAGEDHSFYEHHGIDALGLGGRWITCSREVVVEGESTITRHSAKIDFLDQDEKTAQRKLSQIVLAGS